MIVLQLHSHNSENDRNKDSMSTVSKSVTIRIIDSFHHILRIYSVQRVKERVERVKERVERVKERVESRDWWR